MMLKYVLAASFLSLEKTRSTPLLEEVGKECFQFFINSLLASCFFGRGFLPEGKSRACIVLCKCVWRTLMEQVLIFPASLPYEQWNFVADAKQIRWAQLREQTVGPTRFNKKFKIELWVKGRWAVLEAGILPSCHLWAPFDDKGSFCSVLHALLLSSLLRDWDKAIVVTFGLSPFEMPEWHRPTAFQCGPPDSRIFILQEARNTSRCQMRKCADPLFLVLECPSGRKMRHFKIFTAVVRCERSEGFSSTQWIRPAHSNLFFLSWYWYIPA